MLGKVSGKSSRSSSKTCLTKPTGVAEKLVVNIKSQRVTHEILSSYLARPVKDSVWKASSPHTVCDNNKMVPIRLWNTNKRQVVNLQVVNLHNIFGRAYEPKHKYNAQTHRTLNGCKSISLYKVLVER